MIIKTSDKVQILRFLKHDEFNFDGYMSTRFRGSHKAVNSCIINQRSSFEEPVYMAFNNVVDNDTGSRVDEWYIACDNIIIVCASKEIAEELFGYIATVMEFGDVPAKAIDDLFIF